MENMDNIFSENSLAKIAKRENNNKRKYLVVNPYQGKHIPTSGKRALNMFDALASKVRDKYSDCSEKILIVGFAETATAIGARLAVTLNTLYTQTTREPIQNVEYLFFTESHSHATEQKLCKNDLESVIDNIDRIIFAEDEITTGSTILKIIDIIERLYPNKVKFSAASLLNGMDDQSLLQYSERNIDVIYLVKTHHEGYTEIAESYISDGVYHDKMCDAPENHVNIIDINKNYVNTRRICRGNEYLAACDTLAHNIWECVLNKNKNVRTAVVIGTEEFMYPAIHTTTYLESLGINAVTHSTTRSPIEVSTNENYPLHARYSLSSLYDGERQTFIYDIGKYDAVIIITDSTDISNVGYNSLINALQKAGSENIYLFRWCADE